MSGPNEDQFQCGCSQIHREPGEGVDPVIDNDNVNIKSSEKTFVLKRLFCCSIACCILDDRTAQHNKEMEDIKEKLLTWGNAQPGNGSNQSPITQAEIEQFKRLENFKEDFEKTTPGLGQGSFLDKYHILCTENYGKRLAMLLNPYLAGDKMDEHAWKLWKFMMWPEKYPITEERDLYNSRPRDIMIIEETCKCNNGKYR